MKEKKVNIGLIKRGGNRRKWSDLKGHRRGDENLCSLGQGLRGNLDILRAGGVGRVGVDPDCEEETGKAAEDVLRYPIPN